MCKQTKNKQSLDLRYTFCCLLFCAYNFAILLIKANNVETDINKRKVFFFYFSKTKKLPFEKNEKG